MAINEAWHRANKMPSKATLDQRVQWHLEHSRQCGCRKMPSTIEAEIKKRDLA